MSQAPCRRSSPPSLPGPAAGQAGIRRNLSLRSLARPSESTSRRAHWQGHCDSKHLLLSVGPPGAAELLTHAAARRPGEMRPKYI